MHTRDPVLRSNASVGGARVIASRPAGSSANQQPR
jgi:hypothetical protein